MECRRGLRHQPIDRCKRSLASSRWYTRRRFMLWKFPIRARADRKESSRSMSKASKALERSSSTSPRGEDDCQTLCDTAPPQRKTAAASPKGQGEASGRLPEFGEKRQEHLQAHVQKWEEETRLGHLQKNWRMTDRSPPGGKKNDQGKGNDPEDASSSPDRSHRWTSDVDACWSRRPTDGQTNRAQQRKQQES